MDLLNTTLGAVGQVGDAIDKYTGGRAVRGTLAGKPRELASIVPFSDSLGLTRPEDATSGRDLTDSYGLTTKGSNSFGSHAAGFVADNVLSPANWLGAGAAFKSAPTLAKGAVGAAKALTGADLLDHVAGGAKKLGSFLGGESGSLKLPFDHLTEPPSVMPRSDPDWINGRTNYHGTGISDLDASSLDPRKTDPEGLFGRGVYTTQSPKIAGEYSDARIGTANNLMRSSLFSPGNTRKLMAEKAFSPDLTERMFARNGWTVPDERRLKSDLPYLMDGLAQQILGGSMHPDNHPMGRELFDLYRNRFGGGSIPAKTVYQSQSNFGKILDLDAPPPDDLPVAAEAMAHGLSTRYANKIKDLAGTGANAGKYVSMAKQASLDWGHSDPDHLARMLKGDLGYDALTHTGGLRQGGGKLLHQVTIGLDPNDKYGLGRSTPYSMWEATKNFGQDESGALKIPLKSKEEINATDWFHGSQRPGMRASDLSPSRFLHDDFGPGVFMSENPDVAKYYPGTRGGEGALYRTRLNLDGKVVGLDQGSDKGFLGDAVDIAGDMARDHKSAGSGTLRYENPSWGGDTASFPDFVQSVRGGADNLESYRQLIAIAQAHAAGTGIQDAERSSPLIKALRGRGYDGFTHTTLVHPDGTPIGRKSQVLAALDPNDKLGSGRPSQIGLWEAIKNFGKDESGAFDMGAFKARTNAAIADRTGPRGQVNSAIKDAAQQFARFNTDTQFGPASDLAARFIRPPELPSDPAQAKQLADQFTDTMAKGRDSASAYFGPTYYDINNYLRTLGPEAAQAEVQAIREGRARIPGVKPPEPLSDFQKFDLNSFYKYYGYSPDTFSKLAPDEHGEFFDQLQHYFGTPKMSQPYIDHFKAQSAPSTAAASMDNWDDTPTLAPSPFQNIPDAPAFTPDPAKIAQFEALSKKKISGMLPKDFTKPNDFWGVQAAGKQAFGDQYDNYLTHLGLKLTQPSDLPAFMPDPAKLAEFDKLTGESHEHLSPSEFTNKLDAMGTQAIGKKIFGDEYGKYVDYIGKKAGFSPKSLADSVANASQSAPAFTPDPANFNLPGSPKPDALDALDEADFFGLPPDGATPAPAYSHHSNPSPLAKDALDADEAFRLEGIRKHIAGLSGLIDHSALPQDMDLFRGVDGPGMRKISQLIGAPLNSPEAVGREFVDPAFMSTAFEKKTADSFAGLSSGYNRPDPGVTFTFPQVPAGKPASFMNASEHEVLFPPGRKIKITDNSNYPNLKAELYGTLLAAILGRQAAQYGGQNGNP